MNEYELAPDSGAGLGTILHMQTACYAGYSSIARLVFFLHYLDPDGQNSWVLPNHTIVTNWLLVEDPVPDELSKDAHFVMDTIQDLALKRRSHVFSPTRYGKKSILAPVEFVMAGIFIFTHQSWRLSSLAYQIGRLRDKLRTDHPNQLRVNMGLFDTYDEYVKNVPEEDEESDEEEEEEAGTPPPKSPSASKRSRKDDGGSSKAKKARKTEEIEEDDAVSHFLTWILLLLM